MGKLCFYCSLVKGNNQEVINSSYPNSLIMDTEDSNFSNYKINCESDLYDLIRANVVIKDIDNIYVLNSHLLTRKQVIDLSNTSYDFNKDIYCYGLKVNNMMHLYNGSKNLLIYADEVNFIDAYCKCGNKALYNVRYCDDTEDIKGMNIGVITSKIMCHKCYSEITNKKRVLVKDKEQISLW